MSPASDKNFLFVLIAYQNGYITIDQFLESAAAWNKDPKRDIGEILVEKKFLEEIERYNIQGIVDDRMRRLGGLSNSLSFALDNGSVPDAEDLPKVWADRLNEATKVIPPASDSDGKPISNRYIIRRELGGGGQGIVYEADDLELGRRVAIKKVRPEYQDDPAAMGALIEEARNTGRLDHSGVIPIFDLNKDDRGKPLFAMRLIRGDRLSDVIERIGYGTLNRSEFRLAIRPLLRHLIAVCNAVQYAYDTNNVIHRDIKPDNIMIDRYGETVLMDWGMGKAVSDGNQLDEQSSIFFQPTTFDSDSGSERTKVGTIKGTVHYMSPEQAQGLVDGLDHRTDVYLLGSTLYKMLSGKTPYRMESGNFIAMLQQAKRNQFEPPRQIQGLVPRALEAICLKAMATNPSDRYQKASDLAEDLENWLADEPVVALPEGFLQSTERLLRRHAKSVATAFLILSLGIAGLTWANFAIRAQERKVKASRAIASDVLDDVAGYIADDGLAQIPDSDPIRINLLTEVVSKLEGYIAETPDDQSLKLDLVRLLTRLANVSGRNDPVAALKSFDRASEVFKESASARMSVTDRINWLAAEGDKSYYHSSLLLRTGELDKAISINQQALRIGDQLLKSDPRFAGYGLSKARALFQRAQMLAERQDWKESTASFQAGEAALLPFVKDVIDQEDPSPELLANTDGGTLLFWMVGLTDQGLRELKYDRAQAESRLLEALSAARLAQKLPIGIDGYTYEVQILIQLHKLKLEQKKWGDAKEYHRRVSEAISTSPVKDSLQKELLVLETNQAARIAAVDLPLANSALLRAQKLRETSHLEELASSDPSIALEMAIRLASAKLAVAKQQLSLNQSASEQVSAEQVQAIQDEVRGLVEQAKKLDWTQDIKRELGIVE